MRVSDGGPVLLHRSRATHTSAQELQKFFCQQQLDPGAYKHASKLSTQLEVHAVCVYVVVARF